MITPDSAGRQPTKQRLLDAGVHLFAERGFRETTVGDIEQAAGLQPRRGALYRHFPTKEALLEAALTQHLETVAADGIDLGDLPVADPRAEALIVAAWFLAVIDREEQMVRILEQDGARLPAWQKAFRTSIVDAGYKVMGRFVRRWIGSGPRDNADVDAIAVILLGALVNYRRSTWTYGALPLDLAETVFLDAWADLCIRATEPRLKRRAGR
jgi:AcrR family transcriptional regulator